MSRYLGLRANHEVVAVSSGADGEIVVEAVDRESGQTMQEDTDLLLLATGRASNTDLLDPQRGGIEIDADGWIRTDDYLETTSSNVWAFGDANGRHLFKHVANYEAKVVYYNAVRKEKIPVNYHAAPHAVFGWPEVASVGMGEAEAAATVGEDNVLVGFHRFRETTRGEAMQAGEEFAKIIVDRSTHGILGAHVIGHQASVLIQEVVTLMYTSERSVLPIYQGMHIHPSLSEVIERAVLSLMPLRAYREQPQA
jgi:dihydrolipoamide dehydrogenase